MICPSTPFAFSRPCSNTLGGVAEVYVANPADLYPNVVINVDTGNANFNGVEDTPFYKWEVAENSGNLESTAQVAPENGTAYFQNVLTAVLNGFDANTAGANILLKLGRVAVIAKLRNGKAYYVGALSATGTGPVDGAKLTGLQISSGTQRADGNRATVTFTHESPYLPLRAINFESKINA